MEPSTVRSACPLIVLHIWRCHWSCSRSWNFPTVGLRSYHLRTQGLLHRCSWSPHCRCSSLLWTVNCKLRCCQTVMGLSSKTPTAVQTGLACTTKHPSCWCSMSRNFFCNLLSQCQRRTPGSASGPVWTGRRSPCCLNCLQIRQICKCRSILFPVPVMIHISIRNLLLCWALSRTLSLCLRWNSKIWI